jgi:hypothetical protein
MRNRPTAKQQKDGLIRDKQELEKRWQRTKADYENGVIDAYELGHMIGQINNFDKKLIGLGYRDLLGE